MAVLKNVELQWARLGTPEKKYMSEETQWSVNALVSDKQSRKYLKDKLITKERWIEVNGEDQAIIGFRRDTHYKKSGDARTPVRVVDAYGQDVDANIIGNGSKANIQYSVRDWEFQGRKGRSMELLAVQITELVEYKSLQSAGNEFEFIDRKKVDIDEVDLSDDEFE
jgi:hypothetical protein